MPVRVYFGELSSGTVAIELDDRAVGELQPLREEYFRRTGLRLFDEYGQTWHAAGTLQPIAESASRIADTIATVSLVHSVVLQAIERGIGLAFDGD